MPVPALTLRLSHPNFLDAVLTADGVPVYSLETSANQTSLLRCNPDTDGLEHVATFSWPERESRRRASPKDSGVSVQLRDAQPVPENEFLRLHSGVISWSRKFTLPGQERSLRWRRTQGVLECTSPTHQGPIAHFDHANLTSPAKLRVYVQDMNFQHNYRDTMTCGVNTTLLDYLVMTALLLVTHRDDWRTMPTASATGVSSSTSSPISPTSPQTPFSSSPASPATDSWYRPCPVVNSHRLSRCSTIPTPVRSQAPIAPPVIRPPTHRSRPRTSPSSVSPSTPTSASTVGSLRRSASTLLRPQVHIPVQYVQVLDIDSSPVLDIRPAFPAYGDRSSSPDDESPSSDSEYEIQPARHAPLRLHVPSSGSPPSAARSLPREEIVPFPFLKTDPADLPPPYEEIEWTVRLRTPRRTRSTIGL